MYIPGLDTWRRVGSYQSASWLVNKALKCWVVAMRCVPDRQLAPRHIHIPAGAIVVRLKHARPVLDNTNMGN